MLMHGEHAGSAALRGGNEVSGSGFGHGRLSVAIAVAEALHHSAPLRAWPEMNAAPRGQTTDRRSREHWGTFRRTTRRKCWPPSEGADAGQGVGHVMEQIAETLPARPVVRLSQLVGRADGGSKVRSWVDGDGCEELVEAPTNGCH